VFANTNIVKSVKFFIEKTRTLKHEHKVRPCVTSFFLLRFIEMIMEIMTIIMKGLIAIIIVSCVNAND